MTIKQIIVTGGIGSGKSSVVYRLATYIPTISCDQIVSDLYADASTPMCKEVIKWFSKDIIVDGSIDKKVLRTKLTDQRDYQLLSDICDEFVRDRVKQIVNRLSLTNSLVVIEVPLAIERSWKADYMIAVIASKTTRIERVITRSKLSTRDIVLRMSNQVGIDQIIEAADFIIPNEGSIDQLYHRTDIVYEGINNIHRS